MVPIKVTTVHEEHPDLSRRELHRVTRAAHAAMGIVWATKLLPEHFEAGANSVFRYAKRSERWLRKKRALLSRGRIDPNAMNDLVFTGRLRDSVLRSAKNLIRAYPSRVTISLIGPEYFTLRPRRNNTAQLAREVLAVSPRHERLIGVAAEQGFQRELNHLRRSRRLRKVTTTK